MNRIALALVVLLTSCAPAAVEVAQVISQPLVVEEEPTPRRPVEVRETEVDEFDVEAGRFDGGRMWTFDNAPVDWFREAYALEPDSVWFARARLGALRFASHCSASFVSDSGLILTNHHCAREAVTDVSEAGEDLLGTGFYATEPAQERRVKDLFVEQLIAIEDVTDRIHAASRIVRGDNERLQARQAKVADVERQLSTTTAAADSTLRVEVIKLFSGGRYAAYTFKRYSDVRLVMVPEKQLGYFGGESDNFTYPRYSLDIAFLRAYGPAGEPVVTPDYFRWSSEGIEEGSPVFVVGNPGSTSRLNTTDWLQFERDFVLPAQVEALHNRAEILRPFLGADVPEADAIENLWFSVSNSLKALSGQLDGLRNDTLIARRLASEYQIREDLFKSDSLSSLYGTLFERQADLQRSKQSGAARFSGFAFFGTALGSPTLARAVYGYYYENLRRRGFTDEKVFADIRKEAMAFKDLPDEVEIALIEQRLTELRDALGAQDPTYRTVTGGRSLDSLAAELVRDTAVKDSSGFSALMRQGFLGSADPMASLIGALAPLFFTAQQQQQSFGSREELLNEQLAQLQFALYGISMPPDASGSLRIADGIVSGYAYNGTRAPAFTTFYGLYDHHYAYQSVSTEWDLPEVWQDPPSEFDLSTPLNLVSTNDIAGGNSGSALLNQSLEVVGLVFDGNIESLPNVYLYTDRRARTVSVDARGIMAALTHIYRAERIVAEIEAASR